MPGKHHNTEQKVFELIRLIEEFAKKHNVSRNEACKQLGIPPSRYYYARRYLLTGSWH